MLKDHARLLLNDSLVWDAHAGLGPSPQVDLTRLSQWSDAGIDFLSLNIGYDVVGWENAVLNAAAYRRWLLARPGKFYLVDTVEDVVRARREGRLAVAFDLEGANALAGQLSMLALYHRLGVRQMHLVYNLNNEAGGGCHDHDTGLTAFGRDVVSEANRLGILVDLSHAGPRTAMDIIDCSTAPVVYSHANPTAIADHPRNVGNEHMRACAATGGVIAVTGVGHFLGDPDASPASLARAVETVVDCIGIEHVGLGLDYTWETEDDEEDASLFWPPRFYAGRSSYMKPARLVEVVELLLAKGYSDIDIKALLGGNFLRVAGRVWAGATS